MNTILAALIVAVYLVVTLLLAVIVGRMINSRDEP